MAKLHYPTRMAKVIYALLDHPHGISGREIDFNYNINSARNEAAELARLNGVQVHKERIPNQAETGDYTRYSLPNRAEALKALRLLNGIRNRCDEPILTADEMNNYLARFQE